MRSATLLSVFSALSSSILARTLELGTSPDSTGWGSVKAWIAGEDPCHGGIILATSETTSPCGEHFTYGGFQDLHFEACGSDHL
jgi:hypothetical protein